MLYHPPRACIPFLSNHKKWVKDRLRQFAQHAMFENLKQRCVTEQQATLLKDVHKAMGGQPKSMRTDLHGVQGNMDVKACMSYINGEKLCAHESFEGLVQYLLTQPMVNRIIISGSTATNHRLVHCGRSPSDKCRCGRRGTPEHLFWECTLPDVSAERDRFKHVYDRLLENIRSKDDMQPMNLSCFRNTTLVHEDERLIQPEWDRA